MENKDAASSNIAVIIATPDDVVGIMDVQRITWLDTYPNEEAGITREDVAARFDFSDEERNTYIEKRRQSLTMDPDSHYWVAKEGDNVVGFCGVQKFESINEVGALYVLPEYQGNGIGKRLFEEGLKWLGDEKKIKIEAASYNIKAIKFYKSFGFIETGNPVTSAPHVLPSGMTIPETELIRI